MVPCEKNYLTLSPLVWNIILECMYAEILVKAPVVRETYLNYYDDDSEGGNGCNGEVYHCELGDSFSSQAPTIPVLLLYQLKPVIVSKASPSGYSSKRFK
jgi:hypothetical protein